MVRHAAAGSVLAAEGDAADTFGVVVSGTTRVAHLGADGRRITFETASTGDAIGAVVALAGGRYPFYLEAISEAEVAWLPRTALFDLLEAEPRVARDLISDLADRVVKFTSVVQSLSLDVPARLARYLFQSALASGTPSGTGIRVELPMPKSELASALGTVPETLSRAFARLKADGIITMRGSAVTILDVRSLAALGSGYSED
jgi:CRP/FNR family transcriptional regulator